MSETTVLSAPKLVDRDFRWRGHSVSRIEGFSDAVFSIVLALLFLRAMPPENFTEVKGAMKGLVPFAATFAIIAYVWVEHWLFYRRYDLHDGVTTFLNLLLLFLLLFYAYPLKYLFTLLFVAFFGPIPGMVPVTMETLTVGFDGKQDGTRLFLYYGVGYGAIFGTLALCYARAGRFCTQLQLNAVEVFLTRAGMYQCLLQVGFAVASMLLALSGIGGRIGLPGWIYALIGPTMAAHGIWEGRNVRRLRATA